MSEQALTTPVQPLPTVRTVRRIQPSSGLIPINLAEIWHYRQLLFIFLWRDIRARYKQTFLGPIWAILRPFASMVMFSAIFGGLAGIPSGSDLPYPLFVYSGMLGWTYLSSALTGCSASILNNASLLTKVYFPRLYAPFSAATAPIIDFMLSLTILFGMFAYYQRWPSWHLVFLPFFVLLAMLAGLGVGIWLSGIIVRYRDVNFMLPFGIQLWMYATPVIYPTSFIPERFRWLLALNPLTSVIEGFRWSMVGSPLPDRSVLLASSLFTLALAIGGLFFFRRTERTIVDMI